MENKSLVVLIVEPEKRPYLKVLDGSLESMQQVVNGDIEVVYPFEDEVAIVLNGEGKFTGETYNRAFYNEDGNIVDIIAGTFFVCYAPANSENFMSLPEELIHKYAERFERPERFFRNPKNDKLFAVKQNAKNEYLGVNYQFHEHEDVVDIEFLVYSEDIGLVTIDWHTVEDGSDEFKRIEQVAKEWAGNLSIGRVNAVLGVMKDEKSVDEVLEDAKERCENIGSNEYFKENDEWFTYYVNVKTGEKKLELNVGDIEVEVPGKDDFSREEVLE